MERIRTAVIGSGSISSQYLENMIHFYSNLEVVACSARNIEHARERAAQFGIEARTNEEILSDPSIELVVLLVPTPSHAMLIEQCLRAGKHVYTEKTMTETLEEARAVCDLARETGLRLGCAPDTFLGSAWQTARKALDEGRIGEPLSFSLSINRNVDYLASIFHFLRLPGGGLGYDYGVYYLTALVSLLGPAADVTAVVKNRAQKRTNCVPGTPDYGQVYDYDNESQIYALMNLENGITGTIHMNGDSGLRDLPFFYIYGTKGILCVPCANDFGGPVELLPSPENWSYQDHLELEQVSCIQGGHRGLGPAEMMLAQREGRPHRASMEQAYHVLDILDAMMRSSREGRTVPVPSSCTRPAPLGRDELNLLLQNP